MLSSINAMHLFQIGDYRRAYEAAAISYSQFNSRNYVGVFGPLDSLFVIAYCLLLRRLRRAQLPDGGLGVAVLFGAAIVSALSGVRARLDERREAFVEHLRAGAPPRFRQPQFRHDRRL